MVCATAGSNPRRRRGTNESVRLSPTVIASLSGLVAGLIHVFSGPDHLAAIAPLSVHQRGRGRGWITGARWGLGHATGVILVGILSLWLRERLPSAWLSNWAERLVGMTLIGIGCWGIRKAFTRRMHTHEHVHDGRAHMHIHVHEPVSAHGPAHGASRAHFHTHAAFAVGTLHGLAGSSHLLGVLPSLWLPTKAQTIGYLLAYGLGSILAMAVFSSIMTVAATRFAFSGTGAYRALTVGCSAAAVMIGACWIWG